MPRESESHMLALMSSFNALLQKQLSESGVAERLAAEVRQEFKDVGGRLDGALSKSVTKAIEAALARVLADTAKDIASALRDAVEGLEGSIIAEIRAIKMPDIPKSKDVDLRPVIRAVTDAVGGIEIPAPQVVDLPEQKSSWTFDFVRDKRTGLLEKVIAT